MLAGCFVASLTPTDRSHVLDDIKPYMCTYEHCSLAGKTYSSKKAWWEHERQQHRTKRSWKCEPCEKKNSDSSFTTLEQFQDHISNQHSVPLAKAVMQTISKFCERDDEVLGPSKTCSFCKEDIKGTAKERVMPSERAVRRHMADHLKQLAFFVAFPAGETNFDDVESNFQDDSDSDEDFRSEIGSLASNHDYLPKKQVNDAYVQTFIKSQANYRIAAEGKRVSNAKSANHVPEEGIVVDESEVNTGPTITENEGPAFPIRLLAHPENEHFYARQELLTATENVFSRPGFICVFQGVGGVGKTLAAVQYAYTHQDDFDAIFWLQADTAPGRSESYFQIASALELVDGSEEHVQVMERMRNWLQETGIEKAEPKFSAFS